MHVLKTSTMVCLMLCLARTAVGQGCSDAGVCTAGPLGDISLTAGPGTLGFDNRHDVRVTFSYAVGEQGTVILQTVPELTLRISDRFRVQARVPFMSISGDLGNNSGVGDPLISAAYAIIRGDVTRLDALVGMKFNSGSAAATDNNLRSLPMPYQTSLGTRDLLLGLNFKRERFTAGLAYQHILVNNNKNGYLHLFWMDSPAGQAYFESAGLVRADDAVARVQYAFPIGRLVFQPGLLAIQHVSKDLRTQLDQFGERLVEVDGSQGLTLNITADARLPINESWLVEGSFGTPVITRDERPDGLTRAWVMNLTLAHRFGK